MTDKRIWSKHGTIGKAYSCGDAHKIEIRQHINGSGDSAFGGAKTWPVVEAKFGFQTSEATKALKFSIDLAAFCEEWLRSN